MSLSIRPLMPGATVPGNVTSTDSTITTTLKQGMIIEVLADAFCNINFGAAAVANSTYPIPPNQPILLKVPIRSSGVNATYPGQETPASTDQSQLHAVTASTAHIYVTPFIEN